MLERYMQRVSIFSSSFKQVLGFKVFSLPVFWDAIAAEN
jgi:hypothetical protein